MLNTPVYVNPRSYFLRKPRPAGADETCVIQDESRRDGRIFPGACGEKDKDLAAAPPANSFRPAGPRSFATKAEQRGRHARPPSVCHPQSAVAWGCERHRPLRKVFWKSKGAEQRATSARWYVCACAFSCGDVWGVARDGRPLRKPEESPYWRAAPRRGQDALDPRRRDAFDTRRRSDRGQDALDTRRRDAFDTSRRSNRVARGNCRGTSGGENNVTRTERDQGIGTRDQSKAAFFLVPGPWTLVPCFCLAANPPIVVY